MKMGLGSMILRLGLVAALALMAAFFVVDTELRADDTDTVELDAGLQGAQPEPVAAEAEAPELSSEPKPSMDLSVSVITSDNNIVPLSSMIEGLTFLFYFSSSCPHCQDAAPRIADMSKRYAERGMRVVAVANAATNMLDAEKFSAKYGWDFPVVHDATGRFRSNEELLYTPSAMLVAADGELHLKLQPWYYGADMLLGMELADSAGEDPWSGVEPDRYFGYQVCAECHALESVSWAVTYHSAAYWRLDEDIQSRAECVRCHVTGFGLPGGYSMPVGDDAHPIGEVAAVGCESCHGPGGPHGAANSEGGRQAWDTLVKSEGLCRSCHDKGHSLAFDYNKGLEIIDHSLAVDLSEDEWMQRRKDVFEGKAPRPLMAMPEGDRVGQQACKSCHKKEHRTWRKSPHSKKGGAECEDCHGPGSTHVESSKASDIFGLGETCPLCVLEQLCRGCHDPLGSPDFDLRTWLPKVNHKKALRDF